MAAPARTGRNQELTRNIEYKFDGCITTKIKGNTLLFGTGRVLFPFVFDLYVIKLRPQTNVSRLFRICIHNYYTYAELSV